MKKLILFLLIPVWAIAAEPKVDFFGREIVELTTEKTYILVAEDRNIQLEVTINKDGFGIAQLSPDGSGVPPIVVVSEGGVIETIRSRKEGNREISISDKDGDGLPESRLTLTMNDGKAERILVEELEVISKVVRDVDRTSQQDSDGNAEKPPGIEREQ